MSKYFSICEQPICLTLLSDVVMLKCNNKRNTHVNMASNQEAESAKDISTR